MNLNHRYDRSRGCPGPVPANPVAGNCARPPPPKPPAGPPRHSPPPRTPASQSKPGIAAAFHTGVPIYPLSPALAQPQSGHSQTAIPVCLIRRTMAQ